MGNTWFFIAFCSVMAMASKRSNQADRHRKHIEETAEKIQRNFIGSPKSRPKLDIIFALDASYSPIKEFFEYQQNLTRALIDGFSVSPSNTRVAIVSCSSSYDHFNFFFNTFVNKECVIEFIPTLRNQHQASALDACLRSIHYQVYTMAKDIPRKDAKQVLFVISTSDAYGSSLVAEKLRSIGVEIFGIWFGPKTNNEGYHQLRQVVSQPIKTHLFQLSDIRDTRELVKELNVYHRQQKCKAGSIYKTYYDECSRACECIDGRWTRCARVRHEFTSMVPSYCQMFLRSFKKVTTDKTLKKEFAKLADLHREYFTKFINTSRYFLPWNRNFLLKVENLLRVDDCRVTVPYWDWTLASGNPWKNSSNGMWSTLRGLGGDGSTKRGCVLRGPFREGKWSLEDPEGRMVCLRRKFDKDILLPSVSQIQKLLKTPSNNFNDFERSLRHYHHLVTCAVGGTCCSPDRAWTPEYLLITSFIDHIWGLWQTKKAGRWPTGFPVVSDLLPGFKDYTGELLQPDKQPRCIRVKYRVNRKFTNMTRIIRQL